LRDAIRMKLIHRGDKGGMHASELDQTLVLAGLEGEHVAARAYVRQNRDNTTQAGHRGYQACNHKRSEKRRLIIAGSGDDRGNKPNDHRQRDE
jgi:hypothetical protein